MKLSKTTSPSIGRTRRECKTSKDKEAFRYAICARIVPGVAIDTESGMPSELWNNDPAFKPHKKHLLQEVIRRDGNTSWSQWTVATMIDFLINNAPPDDDEKDTEVSQQPVRRSPRTPKGKETTEDYESKQFPLSSSSPAENKVENGRDDVPGKEECTQAEGNEGDEDGSRVEPMPPVTNSPANDAHGIPNKIFSPESELESSKGAPTLRWKAGRDTIRLVNVLVHLREDFVRCEETLSRSQMELKHKVKEQSGSPSFWERAASVFNDDLAPVAFKIGDEAQFKTLDPTWTGYKASAVILHGKYKKLRSALDTAFNNFIRSGNGEGGEDLQTRKDFMEEGDNEGRKHDDEARIQKLYEVHSSEFWSFCGSEAPLYYFYTAAMRFKILEHSVSRMKFGGANGQNGTSTSNVAKPRPGRKESVDVKAQAAAIIEAMNTKSEKTAESEERQSKIEESKCRLFELAELRRNEEFEERKRAREDEKRRHEEAREDERQRYERELEERKQIREEEKQRYDREFEERKRNYEKEKQHSSDISRYEKSAKILESYASAMKSSRDAEDDFVKESFMKEAVKLKRLYDEISKEESD